MSISSLFPMRSLIPVVVLNDVDAAVPLAHALLEGGIGCIEITLRTQAGLGAIEAIARAVPDIVVGAGTVTNIEQMEEAYNAGAQFQVSPGVTTNMGMYAKRNAIAWLPGVANASNILQALEFDCTHMKFFPAASLGGTSMLMQFESVFPSVSFCPTGGITQQNMQEYAVIPSVFAIGGSWLTPKERIEQKEWKAIAEIARRSVSALDKVR